MLTRLFPKSIDNLYRGRWIAVWLLVPIILLRLVIGFNSMAFTHRIATSADGISLDSFGPGATAEVMQEFALLGLYTFGSGVIGVVVLTRYRAMIPLFYLALLLLQIGSKALQLARSDGLTLAPGAYVILGMLAAAATGLVLSLWDRPARVAG
ncbi:MAG TPA: hypothetical protein VGL66_02570 [Caulobacteraceae bacterium]|jgi:hypothetical protein